MATAFAQREQKQRGVEDSVEILTGGTQPADHIHEEVATVMQEAGIEIGDRTPREITPADLQTADLVITMGCSAQEVCPATWSGENRDWDLPDPDGKPLDTVRQIRNEIEANVRTLFDELVAEQR